MQEESRTIDTARHWLGVAAARAQRGDSAGSVAACEFAVQADPNVFAAHRALARARFSSQDLAACRRSVEELERRFPDAAFTHLFAGHLHKAAGDAPSAEGSYTRALECEPTCGEALYNLIELAPPAADEAFAARVAELALRDDLSVADRINIAFAHARILDRKGEYAAAFDSLHRANDLALGDLARSGIEYDPCDAEARVAHAIAEYPEVAFERAINPLPIDLSPIFVIGMPRSGTTLIEQILASHEDVQAGGERLFAQECAQAFRKARQAAGRSGPIDPGNPRDAGLLETARERYLDALFEHRLNGRWVVDKLPANFVIAGFLRSMFPDAAIIHCRRDARATGFSLYAANFGAHEPWKYELESLAHYYRQYRRLMSHWRSVIPAPFVEVIYEDLVRAPEDAIPALLADIALPFDPACLDFHRHHRPVLTASHARVHQPMYTNAIDHWRHYARWLGSLVAL